MSKKRYFPVTTFEKFAQNVYFLLVENFSDTYYVGGMVRDWLLRRAITDIDLVTAAKPEQVINVLKKNHIKFSDRYRQFGVIEAQWQKHTVEIATLRKDTYGPTRYPKVKFTRSVNQDSRRRDFTVNALYMGLKPQKILDFHGGQKDLLSRQLKFIGSPRRRITEDPLRIVRALRFQKQLQFSLEKRTEEALNTNLFLLKKVSASRLRKEISKLKTVSQQKNIMKLINNHYS